MIHLRNVNKFYLNTKGEKRYIYKDLSFDLPTDSSIAFLGRNGSGKSTILRMIGGIEYPDSGEVVTQKSISWPLALSSGMQTSLTGCENVEFVCKIYGVKNLCSAHNFVMSLAELGDSYNEPVSTYSSGMKSKLAFSISLLVKFDILIIDEIISVGDAQFKKRCEEVIKQLKKEGTNIYLVSHSIKTMKNYCEKGILVKDGQLNFFDDINEAIKQYEKP